MITHILHFYNNGFYYSWRVDTLTFRLMKGDEIHCELMDNAGTLEGLDKITDEWIKFSCDNEYFEVDYIQINHVGFIEAWLMLPSN